MDRHPRVRRWIHDRLCPLASCHGEALAAHMRGITDEQVARVVDGARTSDGALRMALVGVELEWIRGR